MTPQDKIFGVTSWLVEAAREFRDQVEMTRKNHPEFLNAEIDSEMVVFPHSALTQFMSGLDRGCAHLLDAYREIA